MSLSSSHLYIISIVIKNVVNLLLSSHYLLLMQIYIFNLYFGIHYCSYLFSPTYYKYTL